MSFETFEILSMIRDLTCMISTMDDQFLKERLSQIYERAARLQLEGEIDV